MADDPFNIVKDELLKTLNKIRLYIERFNQIQDENEKQKIINELNTSVKGIEWDLLDLEETINIAEKNPQKFRLTSSELSERRKFIQNAKEQIQKTKDSINTNKQNSDSASSQNVQIRMPNMLTSSHGNSSSTGVKSGSSGVRYTKLNDDDDSNDEIDSFDKSRHSGSNGAAGGQYTQKQEQMFKKQDEHLDLISERVSSLKDISQTMNRELESQSKLLDELGNEMENTDGRMQRVTKKVGKLLHLSTDKQQWTAIGILLGVILLLIILLNVIPSRKS